MADMAFLWLLPDCSVHVFHVVCPIQCYLRRHPSRIISSQPRNEHTTCACLVETGGPAFLYSSMTVHYTWSVAELTRLIRGDMEVLPSLDRSHVRVGIISGACKKKIQRLPVSPYVKSLVS